MPIDNGPILDAALELFGEIGVTRTTIGDVAARARINRVTVYRRVGSKDDLVQAVTTRESERLLSAVSVAVQEQSNPAERIAQGFATTVETVRTNPVLLSILASEGSAVLEELTINAADLLGTAIRFTASIAAGAEAPQSRFAVPGAPEIAVRVVHSILLTPSADAPLGTFEDVLAFARRNIVPLFGLESGSDRFVGGA